MDSEEKLKEACQKLVKAKGALTELFNVIDVISLLSQADYSVETAYRLFDRERTELKNTERNLRDTIEYHHKREDEFKSQLAERTSCLNYIAENKSNLEIKLVEKEKEIGELWKKLREEQHWHAQCHKRVESLENDVEKAIIALDQTKKIFKSKTIAQIRKKLIGALPIDKQTKFMFIQPPEPWPEPPKEKSVIIGYQPKSDDLDPGDPPKGGAGLK